MATSSISTLYPYTGDPKNHSEEKWRNLNTANADALKDPRHYLASADLAAAVNVALDLGLPLLLTGAPGCGKSRLADAVAYELGMRNDQDEFKAIRYSVKSDTQGQDLFYHFDTLGRFRNANDAKENSRPANEFIVYHGLGLALMRAKGQCQEFKSLMSPAQWKDFEKLPKEGVRSVVLIDEIDKAPREVPNDLLTEIEDLSFKIPELSHMSEIKLSNEQEQKNRPIIIITSNAERDLPPAFLRRCIYFHVTLPPFHTENPDAKVSIEKIVDERLGKAFEKNDPYLKDALSLFRQFQSKEIQLAHKPSLAELLQWLLFLSRHKPESGIKLKDHPKFEASLGILVKPRNDQERKNRNQVLDQWKKNQT